MCKQERNNGVTYCERVIKSWDNAKDANGPLFLKPRFGSEEFSVVHFAGPVTCGSSPTSALLSILGLLTEAKDEEDDGFSVEELCTKEMTRRWSGGQGCIISLVPPFGPARR